MSRAPSLLAFLLLLVAAAPAAAQSPAARPATIDDAAWLAGRWIGEGLGGQVEEAWAPPQGGQMIGHFRLIRNGAPALYELMLIDVHEGGLRLRVKHFNPDFTGWEERGAWHAFTPRAAAPGDLRFDGLRYRLEGSEMIATVTIRQDGTTQDMRLHLRRAPL